MTPILLTILAAALVVLALLAFAAARETRPLRLPGFASLTPISGRVVGIACLIIAYHLTDDAWHWTTYRAPWPWVLIGSAVAIIAALATDRLERNAETPR